jgi:hypothetical protein
MVPPTSFSPEFRRRFEQLEADKLAWRALKATYESARLLAYRAADPIEAFFPDRPFKFATVEGALLELVGDYDAELLLDGILRKVGWPAAHPLLLWEPGRARPWGFAAHPQGPLDDSARAQIERYGRCPKLLRCLHDGIFAVGLGYAHRIVIARPVRPRDADTLRDPLVRLSDTASDSMDPMADRR